MIMSDESKKFSTWQEVIVDFFETKSAAEEEKFLKDHLKDIKEKCEKQNYFDGEEIKKLFDSKKPKEQSSLDFIRSKFNTVLELDDKPVGFSSEEERDIHEKTLNEISEKYQPAKWITESSRNAGNICFASHVIKLTHSSIKASSFIDNIDSVQESCLTTSALRQRVLDGAVSGNQYAPIYQFLELELNGKKLALTFKSEECRSLEGFSQDATQIGSWNREFRRALFIGKPQSHILAKQVYFPIQNDLSSAYHLLCSIKSSSLAQAIHEKLNKKSKKEKYSEQPHLRYLQKASLKVTASNHGNASQLNAKRGGALTLLNTQPPTWQTQFKPPSNKESIFDLRLDFSSTKDTVDYLREYLLRFEGIDLSVKSPERYKWIERWLSNIIDALLDHIGRIQRLDSGWSRAEDVKLRPEYQYLLDPFREDSDFQALRKSFDWQAMVCDDFARWLNRKLIGKEKKFTPQATHRRMWVKLLQAPLREHNEMIESEQKRRAGIVR